MSKKAKIIVGILVVAAIAATIYYFQVYKPNADKKALEAKAKEDAPATTPKP